MISEVFNVDCLTYMQGLPDKFFDLAIVDPEYRDDNQPTQQMRAKGNMKKWQGKSDQSYFNELFRISANQIIWGGNYYTSFLSENNNWVVWHKNNDGTGFSMCELAWCSVRKNIKLISLRAPQTLQHEGIRIHPTQKPILLYKWLLQNYAKKGDKIFDSHMGSQSSRLAAWDMGFDYYGCELDAEYFEQGNKRFEDFKKQQSLFTPEQTKVKTGLGYDLFASDNVKLNKHLK